MGLGAVFVLARRQSPAEYGATVAGFSAAAITMILVDSGTGTTLTRAIAEGSGTANTTLTSRLLVSTMVLSVCAGLWIAPWHLHLASASAAMGVSSALMPVGALLADGRMLRAALALVGPNALFLAALVLIDRISAPAALLTFAASNSVLLVVSVWGLPLLRPARVRPADVMRIYWTALPLGLSVVATTIYGKIDTVLVAWFISPTAAGSYGTFYRVVLALVGLTAWLEPLVARHLVTTRDMRASVVWVLQRLLAVGLIACLILVLAAPTIARFITHGLTVDLPTAVVLSVYAIPAIMSPTLAFVLVLTHRERIIALISLSLMVVAIVLYPTLIRLAGTAGAATASLVIELGAVALFGRAAFQQLRRRARSQEPLGPSVATSEDGTG
jgi:O-antigen/teichoic acid export membrane protein